MIRLFLVSAIALALSPSPGQAQWVLNGTATCTAAGNQTAHSILADGQGGVFIVWEDYRGGTFPDLYAQRVNAFGQVLWAPNGVAICTAPFNQKLPVIVADGADGFIIAWGDDRASASNYDIYAQRVNGSGVPQWAPNGVPLCTAVRHQQYPRIVSDGAGGAIAIWSDERVANLTYHLYAQRVNSSGVPQWTPNGVGIYTASSTTDGAIASDNAGGAIFAYSNSAPDVYGQRTNAAGVLQWGANGVALCTAPNTQSVNAIVSDGGDGAIVAWQDSRNAADVNLYAQRVNGLGVAQWTANGVVLCAAVNGQDFASMIPDGSGGAIAVWLDYRSGPTHDVYTQKINSVGAVQWTANGVALCTATNEQQQPQLVSDSAGGALFTWVDFRNAIMFPYETGDCYAQRVNTAGTVLWTPNGLLITNAPGDPALPQIASNGSGGAFITWADSRPGSHIDLYTQRFEHELMSRGV